jgi:hypothetical protein
VVPRFRVEAQEFSLTFHQVAHHAQGVQEYPAKWATPGPEEEQGDHGDQQSQVDQEDHGALLIDLR